MLLAPAENYSITNHMELLVAWNGPAKINLEFRSASSDSLRLEVMDHGATLDRLRASHGASARMARHFASVDSLNFQNGGVGQHLVIVDRTSLEYFGESGFAVLTDLFFVRQWFDCLLVQASEGLDVSVHVRQATNQLGGAV